MPAVRLPAPRMPLLRFVCACRSGCGYPFLSYSSPPRSCAFCVVGRLYLDTCCSLGSLVHLRSLPPPFWTDICRCFTTAHFSRTALLRLQFGFRHCCSWDLPARCSACALCLWWMFVLPAHAVATPAVLRLSPFLYLALRLVLRTATTAALRTLPPRYCRLFACLNLRCHHRCCRTAPRFHWTCHCALCVGRRTLIPYTHRCLVRLG